MRLRLISFLLFASAISVAAEDAPPNSAAQQRGFDYLYGLTGTLVELHGILDAEFYERGEEASHPYFDIHHVYLFFQSEPVEHLVVRANVEFEHGAGEGGRVVVDVAEVTYAFSHAFELGIGKLLVPVGIENADHYATRNLMVDRPLASQRLLADEWLDVGLAANGDLQLKGPLHLEYAAQIIQGLRAITGDEARDLQNIDNNSNKTLVGAAYLHWQGLQVGGSGAFGKYDNAGQLSYGAAVVSLHYSLPSLDLRGEYVNRYSEQPGATSRPIHVRDEGAYAQAYWAWRPDWKGLRSVGPGVRWDWLNRHEPTQTVIRQLALGVNFSPNIWLHIKGEYLFSTAASARGYSFQVAAAF